MDAARTDTTRYLAASAFLYGNRFRRMVLDRVRSRPTAWSPEIGYDLPLVAKVCRFADRRETKYELLLVAISFLFFVFGAAVLSQPPYVTAERLLVIGLGLVATVWIVNLYKRGEELSFITNFFKRSNFDPALISQRFRNSYDGDLAELRSSHQQNVIVYGGFVPFVGAGLSLGGWSFDVDLSRAKDEFGVKTEKIPFELDELYDELDRSLERLQIPGMAVRDCVYIRGSDMRNERWLLPNPYRRPCHRIDERLVRSVMRVRGQRFRHYKWIQIYDWGNELVVSYFVRYSKPDKDSLFAEVSGYLLTPLDESLRLADSLLEDEWRQLPLIAARELAKAPFAVISAWTTVYERAWAALRDWRRTEERALWKAIRNNPRYNYGALGSLREGMSSGLYHHYFQKMDQEMYVKRLERKLLDTLVDFLDRHGIDTADLKERETAILNQGIIVQSGSVHAEAMSVGAGAQARSIKRGRLGSTARKRKKEAA